MTTRRRGRRSGPQPEGETYVFQLFVAGDEPNSALALGHLIGLCDTHLPGRYEIHTVDVLKNADVAYRNSVIVTPTLVLTAPLPRVTVFGNLSNPAQVLAALRLAGGR